MALESWLGSLIMPQIDTDAEDIINRGEVRGG